MKALAFSRLHNIESKRLPNTKPALSIMNHCAVKIWPVGARSTSPAMPMFYLNWRTRVSEEDFAGDLIEVALPNGTPPLAIIDAVFAAVEKRKN